MNTGRKTLGLLLIASSVLAGQAQSTGATATKKKKQAVHKKVAPKKTVEQQIQELRGEFQGQIDQLKQQLSQKDQDLQAAQTAAQAAQTAAQQAQQQAQTAQAAASQNNDTVTTLQGAVTDLKTNAASVVATIQEDQKATKAAIENPATLHYKGINITPSGFMAAETVWRQRGLGADVNTPLSSVPFSGQTAARLSEFNASGRQSRVAFLAEGKLSNVTLRGYVEADFLSAGTTSNSNQSNSYTLRQRQVFGQAAFNNGFTFTGGQQWSLVTETKKGLENRQENLPMTIDAQYTAGFSWERQYGVRVTKSFADNKYFLGASVEEAQTLNVGGHGLVTDVYQQAGTGGGLLNPTANYSYNLAPDLVVKAAADPGWGHYEVFGVARFFRARVFPNATAATPSAAGAFTDSTVAGGFGGNIRVPVLKKQVDLGAHALYGDGIGRYGSSTLSDVTERPDGSLAPLHGGSGLLSAEWHATPRLDIYGYYGIDYVRRQYYVLSNGKLSGYGAPTQNTTGCHIEVVPVTSANGGGNVPGSAGGCTADNRQVQEGTLGYWFNFYKGPKGQFRQGITYAYLVRNTWAGTGGSPKGIDNMIFTSFRYYLP